MKSCDSCSGESDILIPILVLDEILDLGGILESHFVFKKKNYCPKCFYIRTNPISALEEDPIKDYCKDLLDGYTSCNCPECGKHGK